MTDQDRSCRTESPDPPSGLGEGGQEVTEVIERALLEADVLAPEMLGVLHDAGTREEFAEWLAKHVTEHVVSPLSRRVEELEAALEGVLALGSIMGGVWYVSAGTHISELDEARALLKDGER